MAEPPSLLSFTSLTEEKGRFWRFCQDHQGTCAHTLGPSNPIFTNFPSCVLGRMCNDSIRKIITAGWSGTVGDGKKAQSLELGEVLCTHTRAGYMVMRSKKAL